MASGKKKEKREVMVGKRIVDISGGGDGEAEKGLEKRVYTRTVNECGVWCDAYGVAKCKGMDFGPEDGVCLAYATVEGTVAVPGTMTLVRQTWACLLGLGTVISGSALLAGALIHCFVLMASSYLSQYLHLYTCDPARA